MIKKALLFIAVIIFSISCSKNTTNQNTTDFDTITNVSEISNFLKKYDGRYYHIHEFPNGIYNHVVYRIENGIIYIGEDKTPINDLSLSGNSLEVMIEGNTQLSNTYNQVYSMVVIDLFDDYIKFYGKSKFNKESFYLPNKDYIVIDTFDKLKNYAGNYYIESFDNNGNVIDKNYTILIDNDGNLYGYLGMTNVGMKFTLKNNILTSYHTYASKGNVIMSYELKKDEIIYRINSLYGEEYSYQLIKSGLFTPYKGKYSSGNIVLTIEENAAYINDLNGNYSSAIMNGNTLIIGDIFFNEDMEEQIVVKEYKIEFNTEKNKAIYTDPNGNIIELIKE